jgi:NhaP-type Na+/H+ or K+/H+ antiporter
MITTSLYAASFVLATYSLFSGDMSVFMAGLLFALAAIGQEHYDQWK